MSDSPDVRMLAAYKLRVGDTVRVEHDLTDVKGTPIATVGTLVDVVIAQARDAEGKIVPGFARPDALVIDVPAAGQAAAARSLVPWHAVTRVTVTTGAPARRLPHPAL